MKKSFCKLLRQYFPRMVEYEDLQSTFIANCVFNSFLCYTAIMLNIVTIHAIRKTSSLPMTLKTLLLSLAVSDVGVGLLVQPFYISLLAKWIQQNNPGCSAFKVFDIITGFFSAASFLGVFALSVDRFLAIHLHLRYQELVTHKRVVSVVISIWVLSAFFSLMTIWGPLEIRTIFISVGTITGLLLSALVYPYDATRIRFRPCNSSKHHRMSRWQISLTSLNLQSVRFTYISCYWFVISLFLSLRPSF